MKTGTLACITIAVLVCSYGAVLAGKSEKKLFVQEGTACWYGKEFHGRRTANGEKFDMNKLTAAHRTLPFGTMIEVTNLSNGKKVVVRINDRGPFIKGRIIDLSYAAAKEIGMVRAGIAKVRLRELTGNESESDNAADENDGENGNADGNDN